MRDDPFAQLGGLDQKLFASQTDVNHEARADRAARRPNRGSGRSAGPPRGRLAGRSDRRAASGPSEWTAHQSTGGPFGGPAGPRQDRPTQRHGYDIYKDQILWLNKTKVGIQERHGCLVTANAMVQLAMDLLIEDYKKRKDRSKLITRLVPRR